MTEHDEDQIVIPVVSEQVHADVVPVETGGVRVIKRVEGHEEILEQELRKGRVEVKRVKTERVVDGPQAAVRSGNTLIIPVVSEVLRVTKEWVVTEEIHITQLEERETVQQRVTVNNEVAEIERFDASGNVVRESAEPTEDERPDETGPQSILRSESRAANISGASTLRPEDSAPATPDRKVLKTRSSMLRERK